MQVKRTRKDAIVKKIAKEKGLDERVVRLIVDSQFKLVRDVMADKEDLRPIRLRYLALFALKSRFKDAKEYKKKPK